jgi:hypothetical protein
MDKFDSPFVQGYVEALLAGLCARPCCPEIATHRWPEFGQGGRRPCERCGLPVIPDMGRNTPSLAFSDLVPETLARIMEDCAALHKMWPSHQSIGHGGAFWKERHRYGSVISQHFPPLTVYIGDDGKIRFQS